MTKRWISLMMVLMVALGCMTVATAAEKDTFAFDRSASAVFEDGTLQTLLERGGDAAEGVVTYVSSSEKNATVDGSGLVTGVLKGRTTITATLKTDKRSYRATVTVNVLRHVSSIEADTSALAVYAADDAAVSGLLTQPTDSQTADAQLPVLVVPMGRALTLRLTALPADANDRKMTVSTDDETVVTVRGYALTPKQTGECIITVASVQDPQVTLQYRVIVVQPVTRLTVRATEDKDVYVGDTLSLAADCLPEDATIKDVTWESANTAIATVNAQGQVTGVGKGRAAIKAVAADGSGRTASFTVTVKQQPTGITLREDNAVINIGSRKTLRATVEPANANDKSVVWASSNEQVATVNRSGVVTPVAPGVCQITCQSEAFPDIVTSADITVHQLVTKVAFTEKTVSFNINTTLRVFWEIAPSNASDASVTLKSSNEQVATVDQDGTIHGLKRGSCTITATANDGSNRRGTIKVNVLQPVEGVHMYNDTIRVGVDETGYAHAVLEPTDASNTHMTWVSADESLATVKGSRTKPAVTGHAWGTTTITGTTEDGGFTTTCTVKVGNYDRAIKITDLYLKDNEIKIVVRNESNMNITRFYFNVECYDKNNEPLICNAGGGTDFDGSYRHTLTPGESTIHGRFDFGDFVQPDSIGRIVMRLTGYTTDEGYSRTIREENQRAVDYRTVDWVDTTAE